MAATRSTRLSGLAAFMLAFLFAVLPGSAQQAPGAAPSATPPSGSPPPQGPAAAVRRPWPEVPAPSLLSALPRADDPSRLVVGFSLVTGPDGADRATVELLDPSGAILDSRLVGKAKAETREVEFGPSRSGRYGLRVVAARAGEAVTKVSAPAFVDWSLPLAAPSGRVLNTGAPGPAPGAPRAAGQPVTGGFTVSWEPVPEADSYELTWVEAAGATVEGMRPASDVVPAATDASRPATDVAPPGARPSARAVSTKDTSCGITGLVLGQRYAITISALRRRERRQAEPIVRTVRAEPDREWRFAWFGQSTKEGVNRLSMLDADAPEFVLDSCTVLPDGQTGDKGGKFTAFHDGLSFYYTTIDPRLEYFVLEATFTVEYLNPAPDGQEGFGLVAMDRLGTNGAASPNHYTNSAGVIATKFEATIGGVKKTCKDTLGARFVTGITPEVLKAGDSGIAQRATSVSRAFSYEASDLVRQGGSYRLRLSKDNTGYHAAWLRDYAPEGWTGEFTLYDPDKLRALDEGPVYVGFAAARGCRVRVSGVRMAVTEAAEDPPALPEPPELVPLVARTDSPAATGLAAYRLVFIANADGSLDIRRDGKPLALGLACRAGEDLARELGLSPGFNDFSLRFTPDPGWKPGPGQALGAWDAETRTLVPWTGSVTLTYSVLYHSRDLPELRVSPEGSFLGSGTEEDPLDLATALMFSKPGQDIVLEGGTYYPERALVIPRGNDGTEADPKRLRAASGARAVLDFRRANGGMQVWGDHWVLEGLEIRNTAGDVKGLQVGGSHNRVSRVTTHHCGDTGLQVSGNSSEPAAKWPQGNLVESCDSYANRDPAGNNADGFAAKLAVGPGNVFRGCASWSNIDDGWDLFTKIETGPIAPVLIEDCVAFSNGTLPDGSGAGEGNGFKLGGDGIAVAHILRNCLSWSNRGSGITSNSNPAVVLERCTSYANRVANVSLYGKGSGPRAFAARGVLSLKCDNADNVREAQGLVSEDNYFWDGARSKNASGLVLGPAAFVSSDTRALCDTGIGAFPRRPDGRLDPGDFLRAGPAMPAGVGARLP